MNCKKHNDHLKVYCETCDEVICRDCTFKEHKKHRFELISDCFPMYHRKILDDLQVVKNRIAEVDVAITGLTEREMEVEKQGEDVKEDILTHAQQLIDQVQMAKRHLLEQVETVVQEKVSILLKEREQAETFRSQLKECEELIERSLKEWSHQQILMKKRRMLDEMKRASRIFEPRVFQPIEKADTKFTKWNVLEVGIGELTRSRCGAVTLNSSLYLANRRSTATLSIHSFDWSPLSLPSSLISCKLYSPSDTQCIECSISEVQQGKYKIKFTPSTSGEHQLMVQVGGLDTSRTPTILPVVLSQKNTYKPKMILPGLSRPLGIAVGDNGDIVVIESGKHCVTVMHKESEMSIHSFGMKGTIDGHFTYPRGLAISHDGHILVTDEHRLQKLTFDGFCVKSVGGSNSGSGQSQFCFPMGIAVHPTTGQIFVADSDNNRIQVFDGNLNFLNTILADIEEPLGNPCSISLDSLEECIYVTEYCRHCVIKFSMGGEYLKWFGTEGSAPGKLNRPSSITVNNDLVYVSEYGNHRVSVFDCKGVFLYCFGKQGKAEEEFNYPDCLTTDGFGSLYVSDSLNNRIAIF